MTLSKDQEANTIEAQLRLEEWSNNVGAERFLSGKWEKGAAGYLAGRHASNYWKAMKEVYEKSSKVPGLNAHIWKIVGSEDNAKRVSLETLVYVLGCPELDTRKGVSRNKLAAAIGKRAEYVLWLNHPIWGAKTFIKGLRLASNSDMGMTSIMQRLKTKKLKKAALAYKPLTPSERVALGTLLLEVMAQATGLIQITKKPGYRQLVKTVEYTDAFYDFLKQWKEVAELFRTIYMPMVVEPRQWDGLIGGGYLMNRTKLTNLEEPEFAACFKNAKPYVLGSVNYMQSIPFQIDREQHWLQRRVWELGHEVGALPRRIALDYPSRDKWEAMGIDPSRHWQAIWHYKADQRKNVDRTRFVHAMVAIDKLKEHDTIYNVWHMDYRGRLYSRGGALSYMRNDLYRSLLKFKQVSPVRGHERAFAWCIGDAYGIQADESMRENWLKENRRLIEVVSEDPVGNLSLWVHAKSPWKFIQLARDWWHYMNDPAYCTGTPFQADQTTSGYGHVACLLRDGEVAEWANVTGKKKGDIYTAIGDEVMKRLRAELKWLKGMEPLSPDDFKLRRCVEWWLSHEPPRDVWKKAVMPYIYGRSFRSLQDEIAVWLKNEIEDYLTGGDLRVIELALILAQRINKATKEMMPSLGNLQRWLSKVGKAQIEAGKRPHWMSPNGVMVQSYQSEVWKENLQLDLAGRTVYIDVNTQKPQAKPTSARNLAADFVHSMEAAFLQQFTWNMAQLKVPLVTVHDCFATTLENYDRMRLGLREHWARFYSTDWLERTRLGASRNLGEDLDSPEYVDTLDLSKVGENPWLFC